MKKYHLTFLIVSIFLLANSCSEEEVEIPQAVTTDISVISSENLIFWIDNEDLTQKINNALTYNYGNALESEIEKTLIFNSDSIQLTVEIDFKQEFQNKYNDQNQQNNSLIIFLEKILINTGYLPITENEYLSKPYQNPPLGSSNNLPSSHDFSSLMPPVGNQGSANSCVGWATGYYLKSYHEKIENNYSYSDETKVMSPTYIWNQIKIGNCGGSQFDDAFEILKIQGVSSYQTMPYTVNDCTTQPNSQQQLEAQNNKILNYYSFNNSSDIVNDVKYYLSNDIPVTIGMKIDDEFQDKFNINYEYIYYGIINTSNTGFHALTLVGYDDNINAVKAINSWGSNWGNDGYCWISYDLFTDGNFFYNNTIRESYWTEDIINNSGQSTISLSNDIDFGNTQINTTSNPQTLTISNIGNESFNVTDITSSNSAFSIINGQSITLQPNDAFDVQIQFTPTNEQNYSGVITVNNDADNANSSNSSIQVTGTGVNNTSNISTISLSGNLNFGNVEVGQSETRNFTISNTGNQSFNVSSISFPNGVYSANWNSGTINAGGSQNVTVTFQPTNVQTYNGTVTVNHNADGGNNTISINGSGFINNTGQPNLRFYEYRIDDDHNNDNDIIEAGEDIDFDIRLENFGNATATDIEVIINTNDPDITMIDNDATYDDMPQGDLEWNGGAFDFEVSPSCPTKSIIFTMLINSNEGSWSDTFTINVQGASGSNSIPITPTDLCTIPEIIQVNTEYEVTLSSSEYFNNYTTGVPIQGQSSGGNNVRGFWLAVQIPNGYYAESISVYDVSSSFDPVIGLKSNCSYDYYPNINNGNNYADSNGNGGNEIFSTGLSGPDSMNNGVYHIRIYHYNGNETPNVSFKIKVE